MSGHEVGQASEGPSIEARTREFFDRPPPEGYLEEWTERLSKPDETARADLKSLLVFRLGSEWLSLPSTRLVEVTLPQPIHSVPHRSGGALLGLVNVRGQIRLCVSLHEVLGVEIPEASSASPAIARMVILHEGAEQWVFPAEEVARSLRVDSGRMRPVPSTLPVGVCHTRSVFEWSGRTVAELDDRRVLESLREHCS